MSQEQLNNRTVGGVDLAFSRAFTYNEPGWLTKIDDPFFTQDLAYYEQPGYGGTTYYSGVTARSASTFKPRPGPPVPRSYGYAYGYDALKRLRAAASDRTTSAATMLIGPQGYDANGNVRQRTRGMAVETYRYQQSATDTTQRNNQVFDVTAQGSASLDFSGDLTGWTWGASNNGPSTSRLVPHNGGQALELGGGSLGHYEYLQVESYLPPRGVYRLTYQVNTPADFAQGTGDARWYVLVRTADGDAAQVVIGTVPETNGTWQQSTIDNVDLGAILSSLAPDAAPVSVVFQLRNARRATTGTLSGVAFTVTSIQIATTADVVGGAYAYTLAGAVQAAPDRGITQITYDPVTTKPRRIERADGAVEALTYDATDNRLTLTMGDETVCYVRSPDGSPLRIERRNGTKTSIVYNVFGERGLLGVVDSAGMAFTLTDKLGSTRVLVRDTNEVLGRLDYLPGGETFRQGGQTLRQGGTPYEYSGQEWDDRIKLYAYPARLYDPVLGRFYAIDIAGGSPYVLAGGNPIDCIDSSGDLPEWVNDAGAALQEWSGTTLSEAGRLCREHPNVVAGTLSVVALGGAYWAMPVATVAVFQEILAFMVSVGATAKSTGIWVVTHPRMSAQLALIGYRFHTSPTWSHFVLSMSVDISVSVVSSHTIVRMFHFLDARFIVERWRPVTWTLGLASVAAQGAVTGQFRRNVWWFIGVQGANDTSLLTQDNLVRDAVTNVVTHALFDSVDFRNGLSPRTPYPPTAATELHIMYLAFPVKWQHPAQWLYWRGWLVPYKGIARGNGSPLDVAAVRHNHHHWSPFGFGPNFPVASSFNYDAIRYLERLVIHWMPAQRITGVGVGTYQKDDWNGPLTATWRDDFLDEFVYWHFRHAFAHITTPVEAIGHLGGSMINATMPKMMIP